MFRLTRELSEEQRIETKKKNNNFPLLVSTFSVPGPLRSVSATLAYRPASVLSRDNNAVTRSSICLSRPGFVSLHSWPARALVVPKNT